MLQKYMAAWAALSISSSSAVNVKPALIETMHDCSLDLPDDVASELLLQGTAFQS
jgi:hypothetical protein